MIPPVEMTILLRPQQVQREMTRAEGLSSRPERSGVEGHAVSFTVLKRSLYPRTDRRVPHISLVFREMWDTADLSLNSVAYPTVPGSKNRGAK
jgi:hypothetical protein